MKPILFWSGGKDSYLALVYWRKISKIDPKLFITYNEQTATVPHQEIPISDIEKQSDKLSLELVKVALPPKCTNEVYIRRVMETLSNETSSRELIFGDLWLEDIRKWREQSFNRYSCIFPLWNSPYELLLEDLWKSNVTVHINAVSPEFQNIIKKGQTYDRNFIKNLPEFIDIMGERGEFHTRVVL